jgi:hypothetical protein
MKIHAYLICFKNILQNILPIPILYPEREIAGAWWCNYLYTWRKNYSLIY